MNNQYMNEILREYERIQDFEEKALASRREYVYRKVPRVKAIDEEIGKTGILLSKVILNHLSNFDEAIQELQEKMRHLKQEKAILLTENNIPLDYLERTYHCASCKDTGFISDGGKCSCFKQKLINKAYEMSNISRVLDKENFNHFSLELFSDHKFEDEDLTPKQNMLNILNVCEGFVINFDKQLDENLFFYGTTGLGKTFMCNCIAKALLDKGKIVVYQTAFKILEILEEYKFNRNRTPNIETSYQLLFDCDLLVVDDLGTEMTNTFTNTEVFNIINSRLIGSKKTIISTNLSPMEIASTYSDRIFSRIFGNFTILKFYGKDLRWEK
ncbi:MAG: ATP-binding protein [Bacillota bacterium]